MTLTNLNQSGKAAKAGSNWKVIYKLGGAAAVIMVVIIIIQFIVFCAWPPPLEGNIVDWFKLFQDNWLRGLLSFELLMVIYSILSILTALALYAVLKPYSQSLTTIYLVLTIVAIVAFITSRPALEMLSLSNQYAAATTDAERSMLVAAGHSMLAAFKGTTFNISYILSSTTGLIISFVMLKANTFSKSIAYTRIISSILDFGLYIPTIGIFISMFSVVFLFVWHILIARSLFRLASKRM